MGFSVETSVPVLTVFLQGLLSFLSLACCPCCLCTSALFVQAAAPDKEARCITAEQGASATPRFVLGISFAFFLLGFGFTAAGQFFRENRMILGGVGALLSPLFGLYQLGLLAPLSC